MQKPMTETSTTARAAASNIADQFRTRRKFARGASYAKPAGGRRSGRHGVLLIVTELVLRSFSRLLRQDRGFDSSNVIAAQVDLLLWSTMAIGGSLLAILAGLPWRQSFPRIVRPLSILSMA
jgi:hypothetical protein